MVFAAAPGAVAELIETDSGFKIVKVEEKKAAVLKPLDAIRLRRATKALLAGGTYDDTTSTPAEISSHGVPAGR